MKDEYTTKDKLINLRSVAEILDISVRQVWRLVAQGDLPSPIKIGRSAKMCLSDIDTYIERLKSQRKQ